MSPLQPNWHGLIPNRWGMLNTVLRRFYHFLRTILLYCGLEISKQWNQETVIRRLYANLLPFPVYQLPACVALRTLAIFPPILIVYYSNFTKSFTLSSYPYNTVTHPFPQPEITFPALCHITVMCRPVRRHGVFAGAFSGARSYTNELSTRTHQEMR